MRENITEVGSESTGPTWEMLEGWLGEGAQELIQGILEEAESGTPATAALARQSVSSAGDPWAEAVTVRRSAVRTRSAGARALGGSKGRSPSPAPAGDPRSVAPKGRLAHVPLHTRPPDQVRERFRSSHRRKRLQIARLGNGPTAFQRRSRAFGVRSCQRRLKKLQTLE